MKSSLINKINAATDFASEWTAIFGTPPRPGKFSCVCPDHVHSSGTPSAVFYRDDASRITCYRCYGYCNRTYTTYDLLRWYNPARIDELTRTLLPDVPTYVPEEVVAVPIDRSKPLHEILSTITNIPL